MWECFITNKCWWEHFSTNITRKRFGPKLNLLGIFFVYFGFSLFRSMFSWYILERWRIRRTKEWISARSVSQLVAICFQPLLLFETLTHTIDIPSTAATFPFFFCSKTENVLTVDNECNNTSCSCGKFQLRNFFACFQLADRSFSFFTTSLTVDTRMQLTRTVLNL